MDLIAELILSVLIVWGLVKWNWLTASGAVMAWLLAFTVLFLAQWSIWPLVTFLALGSLAGKIRINRGDTKNDSVMVGEGNGSDAKQGLARDHWQVLANGGNFMLLAMLSFLNGSGWVEFVVGIHTDFLRLGETCHLLALISLSVSCADTLSSDFGRIWGGNPRNIITGKLMLKGVSGGVTVLGFVGALLGAVSIAIFVFWSEFSLIGSRESLFWVVVVFGFLGSVLDSVLGVLFQAKYLDVWGNFLDSSDGGIRPLCGGYKWVTNDVVNAVTGILMLLVAVMYLCW